MTERGAERVHDFGVMNRMTLPQTAQSQPAEAGAVQWELDGQPIDGAPQDDPNADALDPNQPPGPQVQAPAEPSELERIALELGWTPQDKWRGDPNKWTPAADYIRSTGRVLDRTKQQARQERGEVARLRADIEYLKKNQRTLSEQRADELFNQYEEAKFNAAKEGNQELYGKLVKEQQEVMAKFRPAAEPQPQGPQEGDVYAQAEAIMADPVAARFFEANPIAIQDEGAWNLMEREMNAVAQRGGGAAAQFRAAEDALRYAYPHIYDPQPAPAHHSQTQPRAPAGQPSGGQFAQPQQRRPAPPMAGASRVAPQGERAAVDRLDGEARAFLNAKVAAGEIKDPERWAKVYLGEKVPIVGAA